MAHKAFGNGQLRNVPVQFQRRRAPSIREIIVTSQTERERRKALRPERAFHRKVPTEPVGTFPARLYPYACFACRKSFKRKLSEGSEVGMPDKTCPHCGGVAIGLSRNFKAPPMNDIQQWKKVAYLVKNGFRFYHQYDESGQAVPYPATMAEAPKFVLLYKNRR